MKRNGGNVRMHLVVKGKLLNRPNESAEVVTVDETDGPSGNQRHIARKLAKENKKQAKSIRIELFAGFASVLTEFRDEKQKHHAEKIEKINIANEKKNEFLQIQKSQLFQAEEANWIQNEKLKLEQDRDDASIMMMEFNGSSTRRILLNAPFRDHSKEMWELLM
ncbi:hypothetical protein OROMI_019844 [Orobanche minor]